MTEQELQKLVEETSLVYFKRPFRHQAVFNKRLKTTGGRYHLQTHHIDFNPKVLEKYGMDEFLGVIKHELCHYHLHLLNRGYRHQDKDFKMLLKQVNGSRFVKTLTEGTSKWQYQCQNCQTIFYRQRQINLNKFCCGKCKGKLILIKKNASKKLV